MSVLLFFCAALLLVCGVYLTICSRFFQFLHFKTVFQATFGKLIKDRDAGGFKAMSIALGSTIGIGNIIGVSAAIMIGGPGAVFWMLVTGFTGMITKYAEIHLCVREAADSGRSFGGPMYVIKNRASGFLKHFGGVFAAFCVLASFFSGNFIQSKAIYEFAMLGFGMDILPVTLITLPVLFIILAGHDRLYQNFSAVFVPFMSVFYILAVLLIIGKNISNVPPAILSVFSSAFGFRQAVGGLSGTLFSAAVRTGVMKGLFTNEAGLGSSPIAHSAAEHTDPFTQGCWGIIEVFIDTVVVCMLTALAVLSSPVYLNGAFSDPFSLICELFRSVYGGFGLKALSIAAWCFAFASVIGWSYYGLKALAFFTDHRAAKKIYILLFLAAVPVSCFLKDDLIWTFTDVFNSFMLIPNAVLLLCLGGEAVTSLKKGKNKNDLQYVSAQMRRRARS